MAQRTSGRLHPGDLSGIRMAAQDAIGLTEFPKLFLGEKTLVSQKNIESQAAVTFAQNETIPFFPFGILRVVSENVVVEDTKNLKQGKGRTKMTTSTTLKNPDHLAPKMKGPLIQSSQSPYLSVN